jgi:outer membrane protein TolC
MHAVTRLAGAAAIGIVLGLPTAPVSAQSTMEALPFDAVVARAMERNPSVAIAATTILRAEALLQQVRSTTLPRLGGTIASTTLDRGRSLGEQTVTPRQQAAVVVSASYPVLAAAQWAARAQAEDQMGLARLSVADVRQQVSLAAAQGYLTVVAQKRLIEVSQRALETARAQVDYNQVRLEGGLGTRLNLLRSAQEAATNQARLEIVRLGVRRAQEALGVLVGADGPVDTAGEPVFDVASVGAESTWMTARPDVQLGVAQQRAAERVVADSRKDWWPTGTVAFDPQYVTPSGIFQPSRTWRFTVLFSQPILDGGLRRGLKAQRVSARDAATLALGQLRLRARAEVRTAQAAVDAYDRAFTGAREAAIHAAEVLQITILAFEAGASTNIEVIDALRAARDVETAAAQAEDSARQARLDLVVALGRFPN